MLFNERNTAQRHLGSVSDAKGQSDQGGTRGGQHVGSREKSVLAATR